ncbi:hypothetical protein QF035_000783 [Streptomyces umbrinus]|uniref:Uncharacterized protein n=1 Tax=Streptomyces umbrinus TaxID=67370 RepID=A0ABU0SKF7_9ACTN|nr:hypothetical protein [Streptomyces umbrinus]MDQ1023201.1 hypothetical protein [Streptomyces umbrinus]
MAPRPREPGHANNCTIGLAEATKPVSSGPKPGDSGSPVFRALTQKS